MKSSGCWGIQIHILDTIGLKENSFSMSVKSLSDKSFFINILFVTLPLLLCYFAFSLIFSNPFILFLEIKNSPKSDQRKFSFIYANICLYSGCDTTLSLRETMLLFQSTSSSEGLPDLQGPPWGESFIFPELSFKRPLFWE